MRRRFSVAAAALVGLTVAIVVPAQAAALRCPAGLPGDHAGFEQVGSVPGSGVPLDRLRLFDGPPGEEAKPAPAELEPDHSSQQGGRIASTWRFAGDEALLMVCTYRGSAAYYRASPRPLPQRCTMRRDARRTTASCE